MTNIIKHKRSSISGVIPAADNLSSGELAINTADGKLFTRKSDGTVVELTLPSSIDGGEVVYDSLLNGLTSFWLLDRAIGSLPDSLGSNTMFAPVSLPSAQGIQSHGVLLSPGEFLYCSSNFSNRRSISFWIKVPSAPASDFNFISFGQFASQNNTGRVKISSDMKISWLENTTVAVQGTSANIPVNTWTHVALVRENNGVNSSLVKTYVNGVIAGTVTGLSDTLVFGSSDVMTLGLFNNASIMLDCLGIWNRALSATEVANLYGSGVAYSVPSTPITPIDPAAFINFSATSPILSLSVSVSGSSYSLFPAFDTSLNDYGILTGSSSIGSAVTYTLTVNGSSSTATGLVGNVIKASYASSAYYIRLLPSDIPLGTVVNAPASGYEPGFYLATTRRDINASNYNIVYDQNGLPFWYSQQPGLPQINQPGNDRNKLVIQQRGTTGQRYALQITDSSVLSKAYDFLPATKNGRTYSYTWQQHELLQLSSPPNRRGNIFTHTFVSTPALGSQAVNDKAYGIYIQEQTPNTAQIVWDWWTSDYFNQPAVNVNSLVQNGTTATAVAYQHKFTTGMNVQISGATPSLFNGSFVVTRVDSDTFTYTVASSGNNTASGSITATGTDTLIASFFHMNSSDVHPVTGDILCSFRNCSAVLCIEAATKKVKWVIQGPTCTASVPLAQVADPTATANTKFLTLDSEPQYMGFQYSGPCAQHTAKWCPSVEPITPGNQVISMFDDQTGFFAGAASQIAPKTVSSLVQNGNTVTAVSTSHGFTNGSYVQIIGSSQSTLNGIYPVVRIDANTFSYSVQGSANINGGTTSTKTVSSLTQNGNVVTAISNSHGFSTGSCVQISGAAISLLNGPFQITVIDANTFTYSVVTSGSFVATGSISATKLVALAIKGQQYFPNSGPRSRGVVYEIDLAQNKAIHRSSVFSSNGTSGYLGSYQIVQHKSGAYSHVLDFTGEHPQLVEYSDQGNGTSPGSIVFSMDLPGDLYRIIKTERDFFELDYLRATIGLSTTNVT